MAAKSDLKKYEELLALMSKLHKDTGKLEEMHKYIEESFEKEKTELSKVEGKVKETVNAFQNEIDDVYNQLVKETEDRIEEKSAQLAELEKSLDRKIKEVQKLNKKLDDSIASAQNGFPNDLFDPIDEDYIEMLVCESLFKAGVEPEIDTDDPVLDYFKSLGFSVLDERQYGGSRWVFGDEKEIREHLTSGVEAHKGTKFKFANHERLDLWGMKIFN